MPTFSGIGGKPQSLGDATRRAADTSTKRMDAHDMLSVPCLLAVRVNGPEDRRMGPGSFDQFITVEKGTLRPNGIASQPHRLDLRSLDGQRSRS